MAQYGGGAYSSSMGTGGQNQYATYNVGGGGAGGGGAYAPVSQTGGYGGSGGYNDAYTGGSAPMYDDGDRYSRNNYGDGGMYGGGGGGGGGRMSSYDQPSFLGGVTSGRFLMKEMWVNCLILEAQRAISSVVSGMVGGWIRGNEYSHDRYVDDVAPTIIDKIRQVIAHEVGWDADVRLAYLPPFSGGTQRWAPTLQVGSQTLMVFRCQLLRRSHVSAASVCCCCCDLLHPPTNRTDTLRTVENGVQQLLRDGEPRVRALVQACDANSQEYLMAEQGWCSRGAASQCVERARRERGYGTRGGGFGGGGYGGGGYGGGSYY